MPGAARQAAIPYRGQYRDRRHAKEDFTIPMVRQRRLRLETGEDGRIEDRRMEG